MKVLLSSSARCVNVGAARCNSSVADLKQVKDKQQSKDETRQSTVECGRFTIRICVFCHNSCISAVPTEFLAKNSPLFTKKVGRKGKRKRSAYRESSDQHDSRMRSGEKKDRGTSERARRKSERVDRFRVARSLAGFSSATHEGRALRKGTTTRGRMDGASEKAL